MEPAWGQKCSQPSTQIPYLAPATGQRGGGGRTMDKALTPAAPGHSPTSLRVTSAHTHLLPRTPPRQSHCYYFWHPAPGPQRHLTTHHTQESEFPGDSEDRRCERQGIRFSAFTKVSCGSFRELYFSLTVYSEKCTREPQSLKHVRLAICTSQTQALPQFTLGIIFCT